MHEKFQHKFSGCKVIEKVIKNGDRILGGQNCPPQLTVVDKTVASLLQNQGIKFSLHCGQCWKYNLPFLILGIASA